jgi:pimeloyl-ACP methyl ester carboxylesterase
VVGADDVYTPVPTAEELHRLIPHATLTVVPDAGHLPSAEQPALFKAALLHFLAAVEA